MFEKVEILTPQIEGFWITSWINGLSVYKLNLVSNPLSDEASQLIWILLSLSDKLELNHSISFDPFGALKSIRSGKKEKDLILPFKYQNKLKLTFNFSSY